MPNDRRDGNHPHDWSRATRRRSSGGDLPDEWNATRVDLDGFVAKIWEEGPTLVLTNYQIYLPYEFVPVDRQVEIIGIFEHKRPGETPGSLVSQRLAAMSNLPWWLVKSLEETANGKSQYELSNNKGMVPFKGGAAEIVRATEMDARYALRRQS
jgi:hypothetical protein